MTTPPVMSTMCVGRGIVFPNDSVWRLQPPDIKEMVELWSGNSGLSVPPPMMRTGVYGMGADGSVWEYAPTAPGGLTQLFNGQYLPVVNGISPSSGQTGTSVTITGTNFTGATAVKFGSTNATSFVVNSNTSITAVSPAGLAGTTIAITVTNPSGTSIAGAPSQFTGLIASTNWNPADSNNCALSNGNLTANITSVLGTPGVRGVNGLGTGKYYWESTMTTWNGGADIGLATATSSLSGGQPGQAAATFNNGTPGAIVINSGVNGNLGGRANGDIIGIATDLTARLIWFRVCPSGNWNGSGTANPATGAGGFNISSLTGNLYPHFAGGLNQQTTTNFGAGAFSGAVPSGFIAGWGS